MSDDRKVNIDPVVAAAMNAYFEALAKGLCPVCNQPVEKEQQIGRCVYALPCNHRLFQGTARKKKVIHCSVCQTELTPATTFTYNGVIYCPDHLPAYDKHQQW